MLLRRSHSICQPHALFAQVGLTLLLATPMCVGCRAPWRTAGGEPSFDRLIEIEQRSQGRAPAREPLTSRMRPGETKYPVASRTQPPAVETASRGISDGDDVTADQEFEDMLADVPPAQRELLRREMRTRFPQDEPAALAANEPPPRATSSLKARRALSDVGDEFDNDSAVSFSMSDKEDPESSMEGYVGESKYQLAGKSPQNAPSSRATKNPQAASPTVPPHGRDVDRAVVALAQEVPAAANEVVTASYANAKGSQPSSEQELDWRAHVYEALRQLEEQGPTSSPEEKVHLAMVDRLLNLSVGDLNAASKPIDGLQANGQDYIRHTLEALYEVANPAGNPVEIKRYTLAMLSQRKALNSLAAVSNLEVRNVAICTEVDGFGVVSKFPKYNFKPDQELLLYCELDNFVSSFAEGKGYETQLQGSYEIVDDSGRRVADQLLPLDSHLCRNQRRDYFIAYRIYMPQKIQAGRYSLKLTVEDLKGRKFGQSSLDFQIVN